MAGSGPVPWPPPAPAALIVLGAAAAAAAAERDGVDVAALATGVAATFRTAVRPERAFAAARRASEPGGPPAAEVRARAVVAWSETVAMRGILPARRFMRRLSWGRAVEEHRRRVHPPGETHETLSLETLTASSTRTQGMS
ncbi:hypothetical protein ASNO1_44520 [Corallococcus caeni]|uniref:Secreted protein n=1 Tax=Corallococcus caeni TaxID=3082388 RepID=A0ABQ6QW34_9BACT|nr:hypothetical protein ASNO1_44520 [Corallococcus sp. NO1]